MTLRYGLNGSNLLPGSKLEQIQLQLGVSLRLRPQVERDRRELIHHRFGAAALGHVHSFDVGAATVAGFHADVLHFFGGVDGELGVVFFAASGTDDAPELPFRDAKRADQRTLAAVSQWSQNAEARLPVAKGTSIRRGPDCVLWELGAGGDRIGLKKSASKKFARPGRE